MKPHTYTLNDGCGGWIKFTFEDGKWRIFGTRFKSEIPAEWLHELLEYFKENLK